MQKKRSNYPRSQVAVAVAPTPDPFDLLGMWLGLNASQKASLVLATYGITAFLWVLHPLPAHAAFFVDGENWLVGIMPLLEEPLRLLINAIRAYVLITFLSRMVTAYNALNRGDEWGQVFQEAIRLPLVLSIIDLVITIFIIN